MNDIAATLARGHALNHKNALKRWARSTTCN